MLVPEGHILTRPFAGSTTSTKDGEGLAYVPVDHTLWIVDDNSDALFEVDVATGALLQTVDADALADALEFGGESAAGLDRTGDLEAIAYDAVNDVIYAFSGSCCSSESLPTVFRLARTDPDDPFEVESYQALVDEIGSAAVTAGELYVAVSDLEIHPYDYEANELGSGFRIDGITGKIWGMGFSDDGTILYVGNSTTTLFRVDWATLEIVPDWEFSLSDSLDEPRAVEPIADRLYVLDGDDGVSSSDPLKYAVHIFLIEFV